MFRKMIAAIFVLVSASVFASTQAATNTAADPFGSPNPVEPSNDGTKSSSVPDVHGTYSVENFQGTQVNLSYTHDSADGFRNYLSRFYPANFSYRDAGVGTWAFHDISGGDNLDLWTSGTVDYGIDAVMACWHSSHGAMDTTGRFRTSMGSNWYGRGYTAYSSSMTLGGNAGRFGDERLRYMFWDTCQSVRTTGGHTPFRTWKPRANGIRMIFGYDSNSVDNPNYGKFFWEEWNKGKSFTLAFLDASWRISHGQSPAVVAFGSTLAEAYSRRDTERLLYRGAVSSAAAGWSWYTSTAAAAARAGGSAPEVPRVVHAFEGATGNNGDETFKKVLAPFGTKSLDDIAIVDRPFNIRAIGRDDLTLVVEADGDWEMALLGENSSNGKAGDREEDLVAAAIDLVERHGIAENVTYRLGDVRKMMVSGIAEDGKAANERVAQTTIVLDQVLNGLPFVDPDAGHIEVTFDMSKGAPSRIRNTFRVPTSAYGKGLEKHENRSIEDLRAAALAKLSGTDRSIRLDLVPGTETIGYAMVDGMLKAVYRALFSNPSDPDSRLAQAEVVLGEESGTGEQSGEGPTPRPRRLGEPHNPR